jgi:hypothetical protein
LRTDIRVSDVHSVASDWFNYGQFLKKQKQPERYAFACLLKAERVLHGASGEDVSVVKNAVKETERQLGREAATVRKDFEAISAEALNLRTEASSAKN